MARIITGQERADFVEALPRQATRRNRRSLLGTPQPDTGIFRKRIPRTALSPAGTSQHSHRCQRPGMENRSGTNVHLVCTAILQREAIERELSLSTAPSIRSLLAQSPLRLPCLTSVVGQVANVASARGRDPGFYWRVRLFTRLDAIEEILHV